MSSFNNVGDFGSTAEADAALRENESQFGRGLRSGAYGAGSQINTLAGAIGQELGAQDFARGRFATAREYQQEAAANAPRVSSFRDVGNLRDAFDYGAGVLGQAVPYAAGALGATALTGGAAIPAIAANTALLAPFEMGDVLQRQQELGKPLSLRDAAMTGGLSAIAQAAVPGLAASKALGKTAARTAGRELLAAPVENALTGVAGEGIKQAGSGQALNTDALAEAGVGGAVGGLPFGALGAAGTARGRVGDAAQAVAGAAKEAGGKVMDLAGAAKEKAVGAVGALPDAPELAQGLKNRSQEAADALEALTGKVRDRASSATEAVSQGLPAGFKDLAGKTGDEFNTLLAKMDQDTIPQVKAWGEKLMGDAGLDEGRRTQVKEALNTLGDEASRTTIATIKKARELGTEAAGKAQGLFDAVKAWYDTDKAASGTKKSEDFSGIRQAITDTVAPALKEVNPAIFDDPKAMTNVADGLRMFIEQVAKKEPGKLDSNTVAHLIDTFGDKTTSVLDRVYKATAGEDRASAERFFGALNQIREIQRKDTELSDVLAKNLKQEHQAEYTAADMRELARHLKQWVTRASDGSEQARFNDQRVNDLLAQTFDKPDAVLMTLQKTVKEDQGTLARDALETDENGAPLNQDAVDYTDVLTEGGPQRSLVSKKLVPSPEAHRAQYGNEGQAERLISEAKARDKGLEARWMSAEDFHAADGSEVPAGAEGKGYVVAERMAGSDKLTPEQAASFKFDSSKGDRRTNASVIDAGEGLKLDGMKLGRQRSGEELPWNAADDRGSMVRLQRQVLENVAAVQDALGRKFEVPDTTVVARRGGQDITWGSIKKLRQSTETRDGGNVEEPADRYKRVSKELQRVELEMLKGDAETRRELRPQWEKLKAEVDDMLSADRVQRSMEDRGITEPSDERMSIHELEAIGKVEPHRTNMDGTPVSHAPRKSPKEILAQREAKAQNAEGTPDPKAVAAKKAAFLEKARSGDEALIKALSESNDTKGLQRAGQALAGEPLTPEIRSVTNALQERLRTLAADPDAAYGAQLQKYSAQTVNPAATSTSKLQAEVRKYIDDVLGPQIKVAFANIPHAGDFTSATNTIRVSVHALDPLSTAHHEALHAWFKELGQGWHDNLDDWAAGANMHSNAAVMQPLLKAAESKHVVNQLKALLASEPAALKQLSEPEERVAYMYQFWAAGKLKVDGAPKTVLTKIADLFRKVLGIWSNDERALHILDYFESGGYKADPSAVVKATLEPGTNAVLRKAQDMTRPLTNMAESVMSAGSQRLRDTGIPALRELATLVKATGREEGQDAGFIPAARQERTRIMNRLGEALRPFEREHIAEALKLLQEGHTNGSLQARTVAATVKKVLADTKAYMEQAGVKVGDLGPDYFPRVWDGAYISRHQKEFTTMVEKYVASGQYKGDPRELMRKLIANDGNEFGQETPKPGMQFLKERVLSFIDHADAAPFMRKDMFLILNSYVAQATRRAEWSRRFNDDSSKLFSLMDRAKTEGATTNDIEAARRFVMGVDGTLGDTIDPGLRRLYGNMIVYQNVRLLPLAIFSSVVDPMGVLVRGGTVGDAWGTFTRGVKEIKKTFEKDPKFDLDTELAQTLGVIDDAALSHSLGEMYSQGMVGDTAREINDTFFRYNLMEGFNRSMRVGATRAAIRFIERHADGTAGEHSARWIRELNLEPGQVPMKNGSLDLSNEHVRAAINTWVDGAVLRPDAADKPIWMNDPHWALVSHLKQFVYSFNETIIKRVTHEFQAGNYKPAMALASYVPIMLAADAAKGLLQTGGGGQPEWKDKWGPGDYLWSATQRAGLLGVGQFAVDATQGVGQLTGPTIEQLTDAVQVVGGRESFAPFALKSMPANALYAESVRN